NGWPEPRERAVRPGGVRRPGGRMRRSAVGLWPFLVRSRLLVAGASTMPVGPWPWSSPVRS
ncbi:hypothetical protein, partial [Streptomyces albidoflavus]|uniref:hypothetical protein n=1 Tax=Streptomyces albidoflavus TaxID=1886 RepID=UPI001C54AB19